MQIGDMLCIWNRLNVGVATPQRRNGVRGDIVNMHVHTRTKCITGPTYLRSFTIPSSTNIGNMNNNDSYVFYLHRSIDPFPKKHRNQTQSVDTLGAKQEGTGYLPGVDSIRKINRNAKRSLGMYSYHHIPPICSVLQNLDQNTTNITPRTSTVTTCT